MFSLRSRRLQVVGETENGAHYFQAPATQAIKCFILRFIKRVISFCQQ